MPGAGWICWHAPPRSAVALEAYPGHTALSITRRSYKNDARRVQTPEHAAARARIIEALLRGDNGLELSLRAPAQLLDQLHQGATGDALGARLCALQAGWAERRRHDNRGLPNGVAPLKSWIVSVTGLTA